MDGYTDRMGTVVAPPPREAWLFAQAILGRPTPHVLSPQDQAKSRRAELERLAQFSSRHAQAMRELQASEAQARRDRELLEWAAGISTEAERKLRTLQRKETEERRAWQFYESYWAGLTEWNEADHPRAPKGTSTGGQWVEKGGGGSGSASGKSKSPSFLDGVIRRNQKISDLSGVVTPGMIRSTRIASELQSTAKLPSEVARAAAAGPLTGSKALANGAATAIKDAATLGLRPGQIEVFGVTKEDRQRGYDTAVSISTASGQVLIAVGTGAIASALSKGGSIARTAGGALLASDASGNAVGVVVGVYDARQNGVTLANGAQIAGSVLGLGANAMATRDLGRAASARHAAEIDAFVKKLPRKATPTGKPADLYEIKHAGPYNYELSGGGVKFEIDGYRGSTILEAKHVDKPNSSPYVPGSTCPAPVRASILADTRDRLKKAATIIRSGSTPFKSIEIVTNTPESKALFEKMLREIGLPGTVRVAP
jgi:hypothetical protein